MKEPTPRSSTEDHKSDLESLKKTGPESLQPGFLFLNSINGGRALSPDSTIMR